MPTRSPTQPILSKAGTELHRSKPSLEAEVELLEQHGRRILVRAGSCRSRANYMKRWIKLPQAAAGIDRLRDAYLTVWPQQSPPSVQGLDG